MKATARSSKLTTPKGVRAQRVAGHEQALRSIHTAARRAVTPCVVRSLVWQSGADLDAMVDDFASTHPLDAYRRPELQKHALDSLETAIVDRLSSMPAAEAEQLIRDMVRRSYTRYLLAADVGFELGVAAAQSLR
jgi:hypothetical protein